MAYNKLNTLPTQIGMLTNLDTLTVGPSFILHPSPSPFTLYPPPFILHSPPFFLHFSSCFASHLFLSLLLTYVLALWKWVDNSSNPNWELNAITHALRKLFLLKVFADKIASQEPNRVFSHWVWKFELEKSNCMQTSPFIIISHLFC